VRQSLVESPELAERIDFHDMFIYAVARASGWTWYIDSVPSVDYRQHGDNVIGSNVGVRSALARLRLIGTRWHRQQSIAMTELAITRAEPESRSELERIRALMTSSGVSANLKLARVAGQFRRRPRDRALITTLMLLGVW
jgi:rhamnosyltransferase